MKMMNNNELRLQDLTREIALFEHLIVPIVDEKKNRATIIAEDKTLHKSKYYSTYAQLIKERNQLLAVINGE
jgi:hypothetical protein